MAARETDQRSPRSGRWRLQLPRLTPGRAIALLAGAVAVHLLPSLLPMWIAVALAASALVLLLVAQANRAPTWFALGFAWTLVCASLAIEKRLPADLHGHDFEVIGHVRGLPEVQEGSTRFEFVIESATLDG